jgi:hypothetical protein
MRGIIVIIFCVLLFACHEPAVVNVTGRAEPEVGMVKTRMREDVTYRVEFLPAYQKMLSAKTGVANDSSFSYFRFNVKAARLDKEKELVEYMNYQMQMDFTLKIGADSIPCVFYQAIPKGLGGELEFLVAFESRAVPDMEFVFNDRALRNEQFVFTYTVKDFEKTDNKKAE